MRSGIYRFDIPDDAESPPSISPSLVFDDQLVGGACVGFGKTLVYRNDCSASLISYSLLDADGKLEPSIRPRVLTKKNQSSSVAYFMDEATGRLVQVVQGGRRVGQWCLIENYEYHGKPDISTSNRFELINRETGNPPSATADW
ncbi:hypothetical protein HWV62_28900 [Athelia sp. TMB]|nr:hypothetical protein HWV62_28900 [Athelia sp. TMB]